MVFDWRSKSNSSLAVISSILPRGDFKDIFIEVSTKNKVLSIPEIGNDPKGILKMKVLERVPVRLVRDVDVFRGRNIVKWSSGWSVL